MQYVSGDLFTHVTPNMVIAHVVNDAGGWGAGFSGQLSAHYPIAKQRYREWAAGKRSAPFSLGRIQIMKVTESALPIYACNMLAQHGYMSERNSVPCRAVHLAGCLSKLGEWTTEHQLQVIMPLIGCGLGGLDWEDDVEWLIEKYLPHAIIVRR